MVEVKVRQSPRTGRWFVRAFDAHGIPFLTDVYKSESDALIGAGRIQDQIRTQIEANEVFGDHDPDDE